MGRDVMRCERKEEKRVKINMDAKSGMV